MRRHSYAEDLTPRTLVCAAIGIDPNARRPIATGRPILNWATIRLRQGEVYRRYRAEPYSKFACRSAAMADIEKATLLLEDRPARVPW